MNPDTSRRAVLRSGGVVGIAGLAGCVDRFGGNGGGGGGSGGGTRAPYRDWIPASITGGDAPALIVYVDVQRMLAEFPEEAQDQFNVDQMTSGLDVGEEDVDGVLTATASGRAEHVVAIGSFDPAAIVEARPGVDAEDAGEYEGFTVIGERIAASSSALVLSSDYESVVDTSRGTAAALGQTDAEWDRLLSDISHGTVIGAYEIVESTGSGPTPERGGVAMNAGTGTTAELTGYYDFASDADAREFETDARNEAVEELGGESAELESVERNGRRVVVEITAESFEF